MVERLTTAQAPGWVAARLAGLAGTRWVAIDGFGAAGKSTLATRIAAALPRGVVVSVDEFARPGVATWEHDRFVAELVEPLRAGGDARYERWDVDRDVSLGWRSVAAGAVVIVEGVSSTDVTVPVPWDLTLWLDVPAAVRAARIRERDGERRWAEWIRAEQAYAAEQRPWDRVDAIVVDGQR